MIKLSAFRKAIICLILTLLCTSSFPLSINGDDGTTTNISTAEDLIALANNCRVDSYSKNRVFNITNDIDLKGKNFKGIPIFAGTLNGNNHTIKNVNITSSNIEIGFIGTLAEEGVVDSLTIEGELIADGIVRGIGGIVAANLGTITNCVFKGIIENVSYLPNTEAEQLTGGITSANFSSGVVSLCKSYGRIIGIKNTGGIAGENDGQIMGCVNYASVNKNAKDKSGSVFKDLKIKKLKDIKNILSFSKLYSCENTGGIAGYSKGDIYSSDNKGTIGKSSNGYNVGGIVGKSTGYISNCKNTGEVSGNSNVGGICGQLEPGVIVEYTDDLIKKAEGDVNELFSMVDNTLDSSTNSISNVSANINGLFNNINKVAKCTSEIETIVSDIADDKFDEVGLFKNVLVDAIHTLSSGIELIGGDTTKLTKDLSNGINSILGIGEDLAAILLPGSIERKKVEYRVLIKNPECIDEIYKDSSGHTSGHTGNTWLNLYCDGIVVASANLNLEAKQNEDVVIKELEDGSWEVDFNVFNISETGEPNYYYPEINDGTFPDMEGVIVPQNVSLMYTREAAMGFDFCFEFFSHYGVSGEREMPSTSFSFDIVWENYDDLYNLMPDDFMVYIVNGVLVGMKHVKKTDFTYNEETGNYETSIKIERVQKTSNKDYVFAAKPYYYDVHAITLGGTAPDKLSKFQSKFTQADDNYVDLDFKYTGGTSWGGEILLKVLLLAGAITSDISDAILSFKGAATSLTDISTHLKETMEQFNNESIPAIKRIRVFKGISNDLDYKIDEFSNYVVMVSDSLKNINNSINGAQGTIINGIRSVVDQANIMTDTVFDTIYDAKDYITSLISDESSTVSKEDNLDIYRGIIESCKNYGYIEGKTYVGGVAGSMSLSGIPVITEGNEKGTFGLPAISYRAVIKNTISDASVKAKEGYAGLICGDQDFGAIVSCIANGDVENNGDYTGGIVGLAHGLISNCAFKGSLSGRNYIGGIAGVTSAKDLLVSESNLSNNYSNLKLKDHNKFIGAIAGNYAGAFKDNYYYCEETEGINTYAIEGEYEPMSINVVNRKANIESDKCFVRYIASGNIIDEIETTKGSAVPSSIVPNVPEIPGLIGFWLDSDILGIGVNNNQTIKAVYIPHPIIIVAVVILIILIVFIIKKKTKKNNK